MAENKKSNSFTDIFGLCFTVSLFMVLFILSTGQIYAEDAKEVKKDGRFIAYSDGTVLDTKTQLMWADEDNGRDIPWANAKIYCEDFRGGGYTDWRLPTFDELAGLYDSSKSRPAACMKQHPVHVATEFIDITCFSPWAAETNGSSAGVFNFYNGIRGWSPQSGRITAIRALPVRSTSSVILNKPTRPTRW